MAGPSPEPAGRVAVLHPERPLVLDALPVLPPDTRGPADAVDAARAVVPDGAVPLGPTRSTPDGLVHVLVARTGRTADRAAWRTDPPSGLPDAVAAAVREVLAEDAGDAPVHPLRPPWARRGWWDEATAWVDAALGGRGPGPRTGPLRPQQSWALSAVAAVPTEQGRVWLKALPPLFAREPTVVLLVGTLATSSASGPRPLPGLPRVLAGGRDPDDGGGLMLTADAGPVPDDVLPGERERLATGLARLQVATHDRLDVAVPHGDLDDRSPSALADGLARLAADGVELDRLGADERQTLAARLPADRDRLLALAGTGLPPVLVHGDYHPWNAARRAGWADGEEVAIDWTDASVGVAGLDLVPLAGLRSTGEVDAGPVVDAYVRALAEGLGLPAAQVRTAVTAALPASWLGQALAYDGILRATEPASRWESEGGQERALRGWLRAVTG